MVTYALALFAFLLSTPAREAELLLAQMDAKIRQARTLRVEFEVRSPSGYFNLTNNPARNEVQETVTGVLVLGDRHQFRYELKSALPVGRLLVSDGKRMGGAWPISEGNPPAETPLPAWYAGVLREWPGRAGTLNAMIAVSKLAEKRPAGRPGRRTRRRHRRHDCWSASG